MPRASGFINLLLMGSVVTAFAYEQSRRQHGYYDNSGHWYPTTQPSSYGNGYYSHGYFYHSGGYSGGGYSDSSGHSSGISHGGFGATGHAVGGHS